MDTLHYAIEVQTSYTGTPSPNTFNITSTGLLAWVTDRPRYDGVTVIPTWGLNEIDINGNARTGNNTTVYHQDLLTEDWYDGNAIRQNDFSNLFNYDVSASFSFKIRGDAGLGKAFWDWCQYNGINLCNAIVRLYVVIDDVFHSQWRGIVSQTSYTEQDFTFVCIDEGTILHKIIPPDTLNVVTTQTTAITTVRYNTTNANSQVVDNITPASNQTVTQETIPIVIGNVPHSAVLKFSDQNIFTPFYTGIQGENSDGVLIKFDDIIQTAVFIYNYAYDTLQIAWDGSMHIGELILFSPEPEEMLSIFSFAFTQTLFSANDTRLVGKYLTVISGTNADTEQMYRIAANNASSATLYTDGFGNTKTFYTTAVFIDEALLCSDKTLMLSGTFNSGFNYTLNPATNYPFSANADTWWFKVSDFNIKTAISTINYDGGPYNLVSSVFGATVQKKLDVRGNPTGLIQLFEYDSNTKTYIDVSDCVNFTATGQNLLLKSNMATTDGKIQHIEDIGFSIDVFGIRRGDHNPINPENVLSTPPYYANSFANDTYLPITYFPEIAHTSVIIDGQQHTDGVKFDLTNLHGDDIYYWLTVRFRLNQLNYSYDKILFCPDFRIQNTDSNPQYYQIAPLQYSLFDNYGRIIRLGTTWQRGGNNQYLPSLGTGSSGTRFLVDSTSYNDIHLFPTNLYTSLLNGYAQSQFLQPAPYTPKTGGTVGEYPWQNWFSFDIAAPVTSASSMTKDDLTKNYVQFVEVYTPLISTDSLGNSGGTKWGYIKITVNQIGLIGIRMIDTIKGDLYARIQGEATDINKDLIISAPIPSSYGSLYDLCNSQGLGVNNVFNTSNGSDCTNGDLSTIKGSALAPGDAFTVDSYDAVHQTATASFNYTEGASHNTQGQYLANSVHGAFMHILEDYDQIPHNMIDYGMGTEYWLQSNRRLTDSMGSPGDGCWMVGRTLTEQKNSSDYLNELCCQSCTGLFQNRHGQRALRAFQAYGYSYTTGPGKSPNHDNILIIDGSITEFVKTDWSQTYNSFNLRYSYDPGLKDFTKFFKITHVDDDRGFPTETSDAYNRDWTTYCSGSGLTYTYAAYFWNACHYQWTLNKTVKLASSDVSDLYWFIDSVDYNPLDDTSSGQYSSAYQLLKILIGDPNHQWSTNTYSGWATTQKDIVTYSIPINANTYGTEIFDVISFTDSIYTNGNYRTGWIMSIETNAAEDQYIIKSVLLPLGQ